MMHLSVYYCIIRAVWKGGTGGHQHTEYHPEQYVSGGHSASASLGMGEGVNEESNEKA